MPEFWERLMDVIEPQKQKEIKNDDLIAVQTTILVNNRYSFQNNLIIETYDIH